MSTDTDDTDALLTCDPGGGLHNLLGRTMEDVRSIDATSNFDTQSISVGNKSETSLESKSKLGKTETSLDISDFFNSDGELVLSKLSQLSETTDSDENIAEEKRDSSIIAKRDSSEATSSTADSVTVISSNEPNKELIKCDQNRTSTMSNDVQQDNAENGILKSRKQKISADDVPEDVQAELKRQLIHANRKNPAIQNWLGSGQSQVSYGVLNLNLNDLKTFADGLSRTGHNLFPSQKVSTYIPVKNDKGEQIFTRAPNFRTPGGYKPPENPKPCRDLTDEQIAEEVRKMYAFPDADDDSKNSSKNSNTQGRLNETSSSCGAKSTESDDGTLSVDIIPGKPKVEFDFLHGAPIPNEFGKGKSGKSIKRKLLPNSGNICGGTIDSIPDLGFGIRNIGTETEVKELPIEPINTWITGSEAAAQGINQQKTDSDNKGTKASQKVDKVNNDQPSLETQTKSKSAFSFGYGEEESLLSPIKSTVLGSATRINLSLLQSQRMQPSPQKSDISSSTSSCSQVSNSNDKTSLGSVHARGPKEAHKHRHNRNSNSVQKSSASLDTAGTKSLTTSKRRIIRKASSKLRAMAAREFKESIEAEPAMQSIASDLEKILNEIEIPPEELESLMVKMEDEDIDLSKIGFLDDSEIDGSFTDALSQLQINQCLSQDCVSEMYHVEKFKREQCEKDLRALQETLLAEKQQNSVLEGTLKRRNFMLVQITMAFNRVSKEWKKLEFINSETVGKLQHDQKLLAAACKRSRERISQYEKELHKTVELAEQFKTKLVDVQKERDDSVLILKEANNELEEKIVKLKEDMEILKNERDATLRALRESQIKLDEGKHSFDTMEAQIKALEEKDMESCQRYEELLRAKSQQDTSILDVVTRRDELETMVINLTKELNLEKTSRDQLKKDLLEEADRRNRKEAERLHDYYNKKVQEILKSATEEAAVAQAELKEQMRRAAIESERKLAECKEKFQREIDILKSRYEAEIEKLKRENLHRQLLISSTVKQLQMGDSPNLEVNGIVPARTPYQKETFNSLKGQIPQEGGGSSYKSNAGFAQLSKFTLDHFPSVISSTQHNSADYKTQNEICDVSPFANSGNLLSRLKTSTPIESTGNQHLMASNGDTRNRRQFGQISSHGDGPSANLEKVRSDKSVTITTPEYTELKKLFSHLFEAPAVPEKDHHQMNPLDPALHKCIQDLVKRYSDKTSTDRDGSDLATNVDGKNVDINKNGVEQSNSITEKSTSSNVSNSDIDNRLESLKSNGKVDPNNCKGQSSSQMKPPWK